MLIITQNRRPTALPLATIARARGVEGGWIVTDSAGEEHTVDNISWDLAVEGTPAAVFPAQPGTYLLTGTEEVDGKTIPFQTNVLGWMICADTQVRPVVLDPEALLDKTWDILHPDGRVERSNGVAWDSLEDWVKSP